MWPSSYIRGVSGIGDPRRELEIEGYTVFGQAHGTDPATGEQLGCVFSIPNFLTGGPLIGTWSDTTTIKVLRVRTSPSQQVTHDTTLAGQQVTITIADSAHIQVTVTGVLTQNLVGDLDPNYLGNSVGDWTCGPELPLARVQPGIILTGTWQSQPIINVPIG